jgi:hypothetical protein
LKEYNPIDNPIIIKCKAHETLPIDRILEFQGKLKKLPKEKRDKLQGSICEEGFIAPLFVWDDQGNYRLLDGHQRLTTLLYMREKGWDIPALPVVLIEADNEQDAKEKLLHITSQYGEFSIVGFDEFVKGCEIDFDTINLEMKERRKADGFGTGGDFDSSMVRLPLVVAVSEDQYGQFEELKIRLGIKKDEDTISKLISIAMEAGE